MYKKNPVLKYLSFTLIGTGVGWVYYQMKKTRQILENTIDTSALKMKETSLDEYNEVGFMDMELFYPYEKSNPFKNTMDMLKFSYARRLVRLANSEDTTCRIKALKSLAKVKNLDQWHCSLLASMINSKTAVGLARSGDVDKRLFMEPPLRYHDYNRNMLINVMRDFLINLHMKSQHPCLGYFLSKVFVYEHDNVHIVDNDSSTLELSKFIQSESDVLPKCLESLLHHSSIVKHARDIVQLNGLPLLMEIYHRNKDNENIRLKLCQIISNLSYDKTLLEHIHRSGWIGILSEWVKDENVRISIPAARALVNLDLDENVDYAQHLYLLHPVMRTAKKQDVDVVFVHGLLGGVFYTWRQRNREKSALGIIGKINKKDSILPSANAPDSNNAKSPIQFLRNLKEQIESEDISKDYEIVWDDIPTNITANGEGPYTCPGINHKAPEKSCDSYTQCWPKDWLPEDCNNLRIIGINYNTSLSMWAPICPAEKVKFTLEERSEDLLDKLLEAGLGTRPIVWITHSMGGLIVKKILCNAFESSNPVARNVCLNTKSIIFYSTPHKGSRIANLSQATALLLWPSVEVRELRENSPQLKMIHEKFLDIVKSVPMKIITFVETKSTVVTAMKFNFLLVEPSSGNPGVGEYYEVPQDHLGICKPLSKHSFLYQKVLHAIKDVLVNSEVSEPVNAENKK